MKKFIAKKDTWFDEGTEAFLISSLDVLGTKWFGIFKGTKNGIPDEEHCYVTDFEIITDSKTVVQRDCTLSWV